MLRYTGHPFVDVGVATIAAWNRVARPSELTYEHLQFVASELKRYYSYAEYAKLRGLYCRICFPNSHYTQQKKTLEDRLQYSEKLLFLFQEDTPQLDDNVTCTFFTEKPAVMYATRQHIPMLNSAKSSNFSPMGGRGIPVSGEALLAIHAMPFGCVICRGLSGSRQLLLLHQVRYVDDNSNDMNYIFALNAWRENIKAAQMLGQSPDLDMPTSRYQRTRYVQTILDAQQTLREEGEAPSSSSNISGYFFTNDNRGADIEILHLDSTVLRFIEAAQDYAPRAWRAIQRRGWQPPQGEEVDNEPTPDRTRFWRNRFYEALFLLPQDAAKFLPYLKGHWDLIEIFLKEVMLLTKEQVETYSILGDKLAQYTMDFDSGSWSLYKKLRKAGPSRFRMHIQRIREDYSLRGHLEPHITTDEFIIAFEHPDNANVSFWLARDVIVMRMFDQLHEAGWTMRGEEPIDEEDELIAKEEE